MRFGYADSPYLGCCGKYGHVHIDPYGCWDAPNSHALLVDHLVSEYRDGWVMSLSSPSLHTILPLCPSDVRVGAWIKPFASFKPNVNPAYCWEPVIWRGGHTAQERGGRTAPTVRDFCSASITLQRGLTGAKPLEFCRWVIELMGAQPGEDEFVDLFPGSNAFGRAWANYHRQEVLL